MNSRTPVSQGNSKGVTFTSNVKKSRVSHSPAPEIIRARINKYKRGKSLPLPKKKIIPKQENIPILGAISHRKDLLEKPGARPSFVHDPKGNIFKSKSRKYPTRQRPRPFNPVPSAFSASLRESVRTIYAKGVKSSGLSSTVKAPDPLKKKKTVVLDLPPNKYPIKKETMKPVMNLENKPLFRLSDLKEQGIKETRAIRKFERKQSKMMNLIAKQLNTQLSAEPTKWVAVWGAGLSYKSKKSVVFNFFDPPPKEVRFYAEKPYCTVKFERKEDAERAKIEKSGIGYISLQPLLIGYLAYEPAQENVDISGYKQNPPKGLSLIHEFITPGEEQMLLKELLPEVLQGGTNLKNRRVKHYGYEFRYNTNDIKINEPLTARIPGCLGVIIDRMIKKHLIPRKPEQLTLNYYTPGQGIPPHIDTHSCFEAPIISLSLKSTTVMDLREGERQSSVVLPERSLLLLDDESRYQWTHGIPGRQIDLIPDQIYGGATINERKERLSITFRLIRESQQCNCRFAEYCDTQQIKFSDEFSAEVEEELVHKVYDSIAPHFDQTRHTPWPKVKDFIETIAPGKCLLDVGCGNGKYFNLTDYIYEVGTDMSMELINLARAKKDVEGVRANCMRLPFKDNCFDATICIAVLHHLATKERRLDAIKEIVRVTNTGGECLIYVWAKDQRLNEVKSAYLKRRELRNSCINKSPRPCAIPLQQYKALPVHTPGTEFTANDVLVPWVTEKDGRTEIHHRFYHVFVRGELDELLEQIEPRPRILDSYYDQGNWCIRFQKLSPPNIESNQDGSEPGV